MAVEVALRANNLESSWRNGGGAGGACRPEIHFEDGTDSVGCWHDARNRLALPPTTVAHECCYAAARNEVPRACRDAWVIATASVSKISTRARLAYLHGSDHAGVDLSGLRGLARDGLRAAAVAPGPKRCHHHRAVSPRQMQSNEQRRLGLA